MKRMFLVGFVFAVFCFADYVAAQQAQERAEAPVYKDGDSWQFKAVQVYPRVSTSSLLNGTYIVSYAAGKFVTFQLEDGNKQELGDTALNNMLANNSDRKNLDFPLFVGAKWESRFRLAPPGLQGSWQTATNKVVGIEEVAVPAGKFRAFKIEREMISSGLSGTFVTSYVYYYSPEAGAIVKYSLRVTLNGVPTEDRMDFQLEQINRGEKKGTF